MRYTLSEKKILQKLNIEDFRHMTKDKIVQFASMLPKMDPEVAKAALSQFPSFTGLATDLVTELKQLVSHTYALSNDSQTAFFGVCTKILSSLEKELEDENLSPEQKDQIENKMIEVAKMISEKDSENKKYTSHAMDVFAAITGVITLAAAALLGGSIILNTPEYDENLTDDKESSNYLIDGEYENIY